MSFRFALLATIGLGALLLLPFTPSLSMAQYDDDGWYGDESAYVDNSGFDNDNVVEDSYNPDGSLPDYYSLAGMQPDDEHGYYDDGYADDDWYYDYDDSYAYDSDEDPDNYAVGDNYWFRGDEEGTYSSFWGYDDAGEEGLFDW